MERLTLRNGYQIIKYPQSEQNAIQCYETLETFNTTIMAILNDVLFLCHFKKNFHKANLLIEFY
uniref:Uncharacterized protein n=1 Tax=Octopus bimaculoides TaxID=37653 RepID=A0A0L8G4H2_OCTBM